MKRMLLITLILAVAMVAGVKAQTTDEQKMSNERIEKLKVECPKDCDVKEIDEVVATAKSAAVSTVGIATITKVLTGQPVDNAAMEKVKDLPEKIKELTKQLEKVAQMLPEATKALKEIKNPMKMKSANKSLDYTKQTVTLVTAELTYQTQIINNILSGK